MEVLTRLLPKLVELLVGEYNLQKEVKGGIKFLQTELEHMKAALDKISSTPADQLDKQDKIWARDVRELSYDIEDKVDTFMVRSKGSRPGKQHGFKMVIDRSLDLLMQPKIRHKIAADIRDIKSRVKEVSERRDRYKVNISDVPKPVAIDPRLPARYKEVVDLVGIDEARDEVIKILMEGNAVSKQQDKIVSIVGLGGLGKTTLANVVYKKLKANFDCSAFVSVSQTPNMEKLLKDMLYQLAKKSNESITIIDELREFLENKRFLIVIDDIWDIQVWETVKYALPDNNIGFKIITTTRILSVAKQTGDPYKLKPLSLQNSRNLLYNRIFGNENRGNNEDTEICHYEELAEVSDRILNKCAGVPLAIITVASVLASKGIDKMEWYNVYNSIGTGMKNSEDAENMRKILSFSYYDLPSYLRTCLLYISVFPEDFEIERDRLIWLWIAEGFIQCEERGKSLFKLGESYFNELINRSMIQPIYDYDNIEIVRCRVHDMVLDLIHSLSSEHNFVTLLSDMDHTSASTTVRRLSLQNNKVDQSTTEGTRYMSQVRSVVVFPYAIDQMPPLQSFRVLRVLDLQGCDLSQYCSLKYLENLFHLRYLGLRRTCITQIPQEVVNLKFLLALDVRANEISSLPLTIVHLKHLMCLKVPLKTRVPNEIGSLTSLEELAVLHINDDSSDIIEELGLLTELRVLDINLSIEWNDNLEKSLRKLRKIQNLCITNDVQQDIGGLDTWVGPLHLRTLELRDCCRFTTLPAWLTNPLHLRDLSVLCIAVRELRQGGLEKIGRLPSLCYVDLTVDHENLGIIGRFVISAGLFSCLVRFRLWGFVGPVVFRQGAMPRLTRLSFEFFVHKARQITGSDGGLNMGLGNLLLLQDVGFRLECGGASAEEVEEVKIALKYAAEVHPNHPTLRMR